MLPLAGRVLSLLPLVMFEILLLATCDADLQLQAPVKSARLPLPILPKQSQIDILSVLAAGLPLGKKSNNGTVNFTF